MTHTHTYTYHTHVHTSQTAPDLSRATPYPGENDKWDHAVNRQKREEKKRRRRRAGFGPVGLRRREAQFAFEAR